uniref:Uncharacterized protein n=1 Tax=uncultured marine virus TaxID=186617 RepID=A0A0F7L1V5_9VIRU|nr:hypothetical protein [uncultured marine virus]
MYPILDLATENRLKRLDRRLYVRECRPRIPGRYDIVYEDANGETCIALGKVHEFHDGVFRQLLQCMPWRFNQRFNRFIAANVDSANAQKDAVNTRQLAREASEKMWDDLQFIEQHGGKTDMLAGFVESERQERER